MAAKTSTMPEALDQLHPDEDHHAAHQDRADDAPLERDVLQHDGHLRDAAAESARMRCERESKRERVCARWERARPGAPLHLEIVEEQDEDEEVVDRERLLDKISREELMPLLAPRHAHTPTPKSVALAIVSTVMMIAFWNSRCCASVMSLPPPPRRPRWSQLRPVVATRQRGRLHARAAPRAHFAAHRATGTVATTARRSRARRRRRRGR